jgi:aerobic-type carbon monoxide dehydrogenase small subunit (CoxS/CutS family)
VAVSLIVDGQAVRVDDEGVSLLEVLRDRLGIRSPKDGCSPQGQCGCCTVLVDGHARVACVTPVRRVADRAVTTLAGMPEAPRWAQAFAAHGASQCGFCTPGIIVRLAARARGGPLSAGAVEDALVAHLCRCTGWRTIVEAAVAASGTAALPAPGPVPPASARAGLEGGSPQRTGADVALGEGGFADDGAPAGALVAVPDGRGEWVVADTLSEARAAAGKVQGRRGTAALTWPIEVPPGDWDLVLRTTWVEPAYLEPDASWCAPGGVPVSPVANGGAFGGKLGSPVAAAARALADAHDRPVRALWAREDVVRLGPKRPPIAAGVRRDGTGVVRAARTAGIADAIRSVAPGLIVEEVDVPGPPTSAQVRAAGWAEAAVLLAALGATPGLPSATVVSPGGGWATATLAPDGSIDLRVAAGPPLDAVVLRSYCVGAAHQALGWVTSEGVAVASDGTVLDLTIRSFGILRSAQTPAVRVEIVPAGEPPPGRPDPAPVEPVNGSDAVFAAVAAAVWIARGLPPAWPTEPRRNP